MEPGRPTLLSICRPLNSAPSVQDHKAIMDVCRAETCRAAFRNSAPEARPHNRAMPLADLPILAVGPTRCCLLAQPLLPDAHPEVDTPFRGLALLEVASIDPGGAGTNQTCTPKRRQGRRQSLCTGITSSHRHDHLMKPHNIVKASAWCGPFSDSVAKTSWTTRFPWHHGLPQHEAYKLEYVTRSSAISRRATSDELEKASAGLKPGIQPLFNEDSSPGSRPRSSARRRLTPTGAAPDHGRRALPRGASASTSLDVGTGRPWPPDIRLVVAPSARPPERAASRRRQSLHHAVAVPGGKSVHLDSGHGRWAAPLP